MIVGAVLVLGANPGQLAENVVLGVAPTWKDFILAIPIGMIAYTGIETISNMAEEARDEIKTIPAAIKRVAIAVFAIYFTLPAVALVALPVQQGAGRRVLHAARPDARRRAATRAIRSPAWSRT